MLPSLAIINSHLEELIFRRGFMLRMYSRMFEQRWDVLMPELHKAYPREYYDDQIYVLELCINSTREMLAEKKLELQREFESKIKKHDQIRLFEEGKVEFYNAPFPASKFGEQLNLF